MHDSQWYLFHQSLRVWHGIITDSCCWVKKNEDQERDKKGFVLLCSLLVFLSHAHPCFAMSVEKQIWTVSLCTQFGG